MIFITSEPAGLYEAYKLSKGTLWVSDGYTYGSTATSAIRLPALEGLSDGAYHVIERLESRISLMKAGKSPIYNVTAFFGAPGSPSRPSTNVGGILYHLAVDHNVAIDPDLLKPVKAHIDDLDGIKVFGEVAPVIFSFSTGWDLAVMPLKGE